MDALEAKARGDLPPNIPVFCILLLLAHEDLLSSWERTSTHTHTLQYPKGWFGTFVYVMQERIGETGSTTLLRVGFRILSECNTNGQHIKTGAIGPWKATEQHATQNVAQARRGDQPRYPHLLWPLRWTIAHSKWMVPLHELKGGFRVDLGHDTHAHTLGVGIGA